MAETKPNKGGKSLSAKTDNRKIPIVGIGASAGGLEAIESFFTNMEPVSGMAFIVIQHLSPDYKSYMVELLSKKTAMPVLHAENGMNVEVNHVYLIPPKKNLTIFHGSLILKDQTHDAGINLPIDLFLRSLAEDQGENAVAVILSGTGSDGTRGVRAIKEQGGMVMVQDDETAKFDGMPRAAISTGVADYVLPAEEMPSQLLSFIKHPYQARVELENQVAESQDTLTKIFAELREKTKVDFTHYKQSTIIRRLDRRMAVNNIESLEDYLDYIYQNPGEVFVLHRELLIGVTNFFRDPQAMHALMDNYLPELFRRINDREIRFWVAGCSTGEEPYSLAIMAKEVMERHSLSRDIKIFATDIDRDAITTAGNGVFPESIAADLTPTLLSKYFYNKNGNYQIVRNVREMVVFAQHNLVKDPPFTNIDLISCRNLLIYLQPILQKKAMQMFNFSLNKGGLLFLGSSETIGDMADVFNPLEQKYKIYESTGKFSGNVQTEMRPLYEKRQVGRRPKSDLNREYSWGLDRFLDLLTTTYMPLTIIVNRQMEIVHIFGDTKGYLNVPSGRPEYDLSKLAAKDLGIPLATGIQKVIRTNEAMTYTNIELQGLASRTSVRLKICPLPEKTGQETLIAVFLEEMESGTVMPLPNDEDTYDLNADTQQRIRDLEQELQFSRENLQATIEELETSNEELQATNEELLASNEELQATNEELQSTNEELFTVNSEYQNKINELTELNNDVDNLLTSSLIGILLLDEDLIIRKYSPEIVKAFRILEQDIGRPISHITSNIDDFNLVESLQNVLDTHQVVEKHVSIGHHRKYLVRIHPYSTGPSTYSGVMLTLVDVTNLKRAEKALETSLRKTQDIIHHMPNGLFVYYQDDDGALILESGNSEAVSKTGLDLNSCLGRTFEEIWTGSIEPPLVDIFRDVVSENSVFKDQVTYTDDQIQGRFSITAFPLPDRRLAVIFDEADVS